MSFLKAISKIVRPGAGALMTVGRVANKSPFLKAIPGVGTGLALLGGAATVGSLMGGGSGGMPPLPGMTGGFPGLPGAGDRSIFRNDPNVIAALKGFAIPMAGLRPAFRAPKGFVVVRDAQGDPMGLPKVLAKKFFGWKEPKKPPISVGMWQSLRRAERTIDKIRDMNKAAKKIANFGAMQRKTREIVIEQPGKRVIGRKVA